MKGLHVLLIFALWAGTEALDLQGFEENLQPYCYRSKEDMRADNYLPVIVPYSIESFIALVEKLERYPSEQAARFNTVESIVRFLLYNFRYDDLEYDQSEHTYSTRGVSGVTESHVITQIVLKIFASTTPIDEAFTNDEKCALFFMISHTVNTSLHEGQDFVEISGKRVAKYPIEQGVVSLASEEKQAFALGKVLLGILAGVTAGKTQTAVDIFKQIKPVATSPKSLETLYIDPLYAVTFGDIVSVPKQETSVDKQPRFQSNGFWEDVVCPTKYVLNGVNSDAHSTFALIRGAIDGYAIGNYLRKTKSSLRLSQILRMYYTGGAFSEKPELSVCSRRQLWEDSRNAIQTASRDYEELHSNVIGKTTDKAKVSAYCDMVINHISRESPSIFENIGEYACRLSPTSASLEHETPIDLMAIIDTKIDETKKLAQSQIIGDLSSGFQMRTDGSSVSVFTNRKTTRTGYDLDTLVNGSHVSGCGGCAAENFNTFTTLQITESDVEVIRDLNRTLTSMASADEDKYGIPAQVVLYFNYGNPTDDHQMRGAIWQIHHYFRGTRIFAIGSQPNALRQFVLDQNNDVFNFDGDNIQNVIKDLKTQVEKVPAQFQYKNCYQNNNPQEETEVYEGFISPYRFQYWAMYPKYFLKSFNIELKFKALAGSLKVCFSRDYSRIFDSTRRQPCTDLKTEEQIVYYVKDPCKKRDLDTCEPFYFYLEGRTPPESECQDIRCAKPDQIKFQFSHTGISCNTATRLSAAFAVSVLVVLTVLFQSHFH